MKYPLSEAIYLVAIHAKVHLDSITGIEYEDGSGHRFNYTLNGTETKFIDVKPFEEKREELKTRILLSLYS